MIMPLENQRTTARPSSHGTVNIFLANKNGLVAVNDSRLSSGEEICGEGQKLFRIDDHTLCTIAGWFDTPGPVVGEEHYPTYMAIPNVINFVAERGKLPATLSLEKKLETIGNVVKFTQQLLQQITELAGQNPEELSSQITLATFEGGRLRIGTLEFKCALGHDVSNVLVSASQIIEVSDGLIDLVRGIPTVAEPLLHNFHSPEIRNKVIERYQQSKRKNNGSSLSLNDLLDTAKELVSLTADAYPNYVGGFMQIGMISDGVAEIPQPAPFVCLDNEILPHRFATYRNIVISGFSKDWFAAPRAMAFVIADCAFSKLGEQKLDNRLFFNSRFRDLTFIYRGSPLAIFDKTNVVDNCELVYTAKAQYNSPLLEQLRKDFPHIRMRIATPINIHSYVSDR